MKLLLLLACIGFAVATANPNGRAFSLFSVVSFDNNECTGTSSKNKGTCYTSEECTKNSGSADGHCASGFGVCCMFTLSECGSTVSKNVSYVTNKNYPSSFTTAGSCSYTIQRVNNHICQLRLDFDNLVLAEPATGECSATNTDKLSITTPTGYSPPGTGGLCGDKLDGSHMYIETGNTGSVKLDITIGSAVATRTWSIRVIQLECGVSWKAPEDCVQYFTGISGKISSYNLMGGQMIQGHNYMNCIRQEEGMCKVQYRKIKMDMDATIDAASQSTAAASVQCPVTAIRIPDVEGAVVSEFCGSILSTAGEATVDGVLVANGSPFHVGVFTATGTTLAGFEGFELMYTQIPC